MRSEAAALIASFGSHDDVNLLGRPLHDRIYLLAYPTLTGNHLPVKLVSVFLPRDAL